MRKLLSMLAIIGIATTTTSSVVSCETVNLQPDKKTDLADVSFNEINNYVKDNKNISEQDAIDSVKNIEAKILQQLQANETTNKVTSSDFTTSASDTVKTGDLSAGITVTVTAAESSKILTGVNDVHINFDLSLDLSTLENKSIKFSTSNTLISESEAKERWFDDNEVNFKSINSEVSVNWFETANFIAGDESTPGSVDIFATSTYSEQFKNKLSLSITTTKQETGTIDRTAGNNGIIETTTTETFITSLSNGNIIATTVKRISQLTDRGKIYKAVDDADRYLDKIVELSNGNIIAIGSGSQLARGSTLALNSDGTIDRTVGNNDGVIEDDTLDGIPRSIIQLKNGTILVGTNHKSIYKLTAEGKIDTSVGGGTGKLEDGTFDGEIHSITELSNGTILAGTSVGSIYKLTDEGKIDTTVGGGTGMLEDKTVQGGIYSIKELSNGTILAGTGVSDSNGSIYKLNDNGKIDTSVGDGTGKLEDGTFDHKVISIVELQNGIIIASTGNVASTGLPSSIYRLVL